jgi:hypothetical protein
MSQRRTQRSGCIHTLVYLPELPVFSVAPKPACCLPCVETPLFHLAHVPRDLKRSRLARPASVPSPAVQRGRHPALLAKELNLLSLLARFFRKPAVPSNQPTTARVGIRSTTSGPSFLTYGCLSQTRVAGAWFAHEQLPAAAVRPPASLEPRRRVAPPRPASKSRRQGKPRQDGEKPLR